MSVGSKPESGLNISVAERSGVEEIFRRVPAADPDRTAVNKDKNYFLQHCEAEQIPQTKISQMKEPDVHMIKISWFWRV